MSRTPADVSKLSDDLLTGEEYGKRHFEALRNPRHPDPWPKRGGCMSLIESLDAKRLATLKARCALVGVALVESTDDHDRPVYVVSRWAMCKQLDSLAAVEQWLAMVTGAKPEGVAA
jgi:hypothetical protein